MPVPPADGGERLDHAAVEVEPSGAQVREQRTILLADAQEVADHQRGHRSGEVRDQVHATVSVRRPFEHVERDRRRWPAPWELGCQATSAELRGDQSPHLGVVRRVAESEPAGIELPSDARTTDQVAEVVAERAERRPAPTARRRSR